MKTLLIGFTGKKHSGKTTAKEAIAKHYKIKSINFKDALIDTMRSKLSRTLSLLGEHYNMTVDELFTNKPPMMRTLMQEVGTEIYRDIKDDWWVLEWYKAISSETEECVIVTDDVRFKNEAMILKAKHGVLVRIVREGYEDNVATNHSSETEMDGLEVDYTVTASNKEELEEKIYQLIKSL